jgi:drug/metabolite transporter (DMT)-like permease
MPVVFVLLWSTGFIGAKFGLPYAEPFTFLFIRFVLVVAVLLVIVAVLRSPWPRSPSVIARIALVGILIHGGYLGGVFSAIELGLPAGLVSLIVGLQPVATAAVSGVYLDEHLRARQWLGLVIGLAGVTLAVSDKLSFAVDDMWGLLGAVVAIIGITSGSLYQKKHVANMNLVTGTTIQFAAAAVVMGVLALAFETRAVTWTGEFVFALVWLAVPLSIGAIFLYFIMIRRGAAAKAASLFYLVPGVTAINAYLLLGEKMGLMALCGLALAGVGVFLVTRK